MKKQSLERFWVKKKLFSLWYFFYQAILMVNRIFCSLPGLPYEMFFDFIFFFIETFAVGANIETLNLESKCLPSL